MRRSIPMQQDRHPAGCSAMGHPRPPGSARSDPNPYGNGRMPTDRILPPDQNHGDLTEQLSDIALQPPASRPERPALLTGLLLVGVLLLSVWVLFVQGPGIWGLDQATVWGFDIASYLWWIGLGNAGAVISSLLLLLRHNWRNSLNRLAESITLFSALVAGLFPILHLGRPWLAYWVFPLEFQDLGLWPQFRSPLAWDAYAIFCYLGVVGLFWYVGLIPDLAALRDQARRRFWARVYGVLALGWRGSGRHWTLWHRAYRTIAAISLPFVVTIHAGAALLLAGGPVPGWHSTIFPTLFMLGGTFAGFGLIAALAVLLRRGLGLGNVLTVDHLDLLARLILAVSLAYIYCQLAEIWTLFYKSDRAELLVLRDRYVGQHALVTWAGWIGSIGAAQLLWFRAVRRSPSALLAIGLSIAASIYAIHYMLLVSSLTGGHFPAVWRPYSPTLSEWGLLAGSGGLFIAILLLFLRMAPPISIFEVKQVLADERRTG